MPAYNLKDDLFVIPQGRDRKRVREEVSGRRGRDTGNRVTAATGVDLARFDPTLSLIPSGLSLVLHLRL